MKAVLISIQPYWAFLIIAKLMGWEIDKNKIIEVRKNFPKAEDWNKLVKIYCSKDKNSFNLIPKEYKPLMQKFLGKVIGEFVCDSVYEWKYRQLQGLNGTINTYFPIFAEDLLKTCLTHKDLENYGKGKMLYGWHISDLKIYDKPKELSEFRLPCTQKQCASWCKDMKVENAVCLNKGKRFITRPPQSWCYVEEN